MVSPNVRPLIVSEPASCLAQCAACYIYIQLEDAHMRPDDIGCTFAV